MNDIEKQKINSEVIVGAEIEPEVPTRECSCVRVVGPNRPLSASQMSENQEPEVDKKKLEASLQSCQESMTQWKEKALRAAADFENLKRRTETEKETWSRVAQAAILRDMLAIVDDFDRAFAEKKKTETNADMQAWVAGFEFIRVSLDKILKKWGVTEIVAHNLFNPELHEAIMQVDGEGHDSGEIVQVLQKGFMLHDTVLRPAKVSVAK